MGAGSLRCGQLLLGARVQTVLLHLSGWQRIRWLVYCWYLAYLAQPRQFLLACDHRQSSSLTVLVNHLHRSFEVWVILRDMRRNWRQTLLDIDPIRSTVAHLRVMTPHIVLLKSLLHIILGSLLVFILLDLDLFAASLFIILARVYSFHWTCLFINHCWGVITWFEGKGFRFVIAAHAVFYIHGCVQR